MIRPQIIRTLMDPYASAASGLVLSGEEFYVVADDDLSLLCYPFEEHNPGVSIRLFPGELPEILEERKRLKPDLEALVKVGNELLALPSGSKPNRSIGAMFSVTDRTIRTLDLSAVVTELTQDFPELNIEGAVILGEKLRLLQRGNGKRGENALIDLSLKAFLDGFVQEKVIRRISLGDFNGVPLSFTDAVVHGDEILFLAVAEASASTYLDGDFAGAVLGRMDLDGTIHSMDPLNMPSKPEGIAVRDGHAYLVSDDDDRRSPSKLWRLRLPF